MQVREDTSAPPALNLPSADIELDVCRDDLHEQLVQICNSTLGTKEGWEPVTIGSSSVRSIGGGITNQLFLLTNKQTQSQVLVRRFGDNTEIFIDRRVETCNNLQFNAYGFGAPLLSTFKNGRVESFLDAYTLTPEDMRHSALVPKIAVRLAEFHACNIQYIDRRPKLWTTISSWLEMAKQLTFDDSVKRAAHATLDFESMAKEVSEVKDLCDSTHSPVVFCHNDLLSGNILLVGGRKEGSIEDKSDLPVQLIDFEYGCYSFRGFDWGNHFNEWAGFDCEWEYLPNREQQETFLRAYLETGSVRSVSPEQVNMAVAEAQAFSLASHIYWGVWAILQARYSAIDFDYLAYSALRWKQYHATKAAARALVLTHFQPPVGEPLRPFPPAFPDIPAEEVPLEAPLPTVPVIHGEVVEPVALPLAGSASGGQ